MNQGLKGKLDWLDIEIANLQYGVELLNSHERVEYRRQMADRQTRKRKLQAESPG